MKKINMKEKNKNLIQKPTWLNNCWEIIWTTPSVIIYWLFLASLFAIMILIILAIIVIGIVCLIFVIAFIIACVDMLIGIS